MTAPRFPDWRPIAELPDHVPALVRTMDDPNAASVVVRHPRGADSVLIICGTGWQLAMAPTHFILVRDLPAIGVMKMAMADDAAPWE